MKNQLLGCLEISLFMKEGIGRFDSSLAAMKKSFIIPLLFWPVSIFFRVFNPDTAARPFPEQTIRSALNILISMGISILLMYGMTRLFKKPGRLPQWITLGNWMTFPAVLLMTPLLAMLVTGFHKWDEVYPAIVILMLYQTAIAAYVFVYILQIPWQLAVAFALGGMIIDSEIFMLLA